MTSILSHVSTFLTPCNEKVQNSWILKYFFYKITRIFFDRPNLGTCLEPKIVPFETSGSR